MRFFDVLTKIKNLLTKWRRLHLIKCKCVKYSEVFDPKIAWENPIKEINLTEALQRVDDAIDSPILYSNEPTKVEQSWAYVQYVAKIGNHVIKLKEKGELVEWAKSLK